MNRQAVFDKVKAHLLAQNERAVSQDNTETCLYRGPNGTKCAVGCLILDECYSDELENKVVSDDIVQQALEKSGVKIEDETDEFLLDTLQEMHDKHPIPEWPSRLAAIAKKFELTP